MQRRIKLPRAMLPHAAPNKALQLTAYSLRFALLRSGFRQQLKAGVRPHTTHYRQAYSEHSMNEQASLADITFTENGDVDVAQLNALYRLIGWDNHNRRTESETTEMLRVSHYYIAAHTTEGTLVGFARVCGDSYVAQVLDVITHPAYRCRGIATQCMRGVLAHLQRSRYVSVTLTDGSGIAGFYHRFGFRVGKEVAQRWERGTEIISNSSC